MQGLTIQAIEGIESLIDNQFNSITLQLLGMIPNVSKDKRMIFGTNKDSLTSLFLQALGTKTPNKGEEDLLKTLLRIASGYTNNLRDKTKNSIINSIDSYIKDQSIKNEEVDNEHINSILHEQLDSAKDMIKMIATSQSTKAVNTGTAIQIAKIAQDKGIDDPTVFFIVTQDDVTGFYEYILHLLPDHKTPRVWKLSELISDYYKKGGQYPSINGLHPHCFLGNKGIGVFTEIDGYKNIKKVKIGEKVLTHTGKFKTVLNTLEWYDKKYYKEYIKVRYNLEDKEYTLKVTPEHQFLTQAGWVEAKDLTTSDLLYRVATMADLNGFMPVVLLEVSKIQNGKTGYKLYDLTVEDDESFVVNGIVSHNCRCHLSMLPRSWGFNENGSVTFKSLDWDEFKHQREQYGLPEVPSSPKKKNGKWVF